MKLVYCDIPMMDNIESNLQNYIVKGDSTITYDGEVVFPINKILASKLQKDEEIKIVLIAKLDPLENYKRNISYFENELNSINKNIGAKIQYVEVLSNFDEGIRATHFKLYNDLIDTLVEQSDIYCDITYGPKSLPIEVIYLLKFADKFFKCKVCDIVYGQVNFINGKTKNPVLCNMRSLYHLSNITDSINCNTSQEAKDIVRALLNL